MRYHKLYVSHCRISAYLMSNCVYKLLPSTYRCLCHCRAERMNDLPSMPYYFSNHWICKTFYMPLCICLSHMNMKDNNRKTTTNACHGESTARERERKKRASHNNIYMQQNMNRNIPVQCSFCLVSFSHAQFLTVQLQTSSCLFVCLFCFAIGRRWKLHMTTSWMNSVSDEIQCISAPNFFLISLSPTIKYASFDDPKQIKWLHMEMDGRKFPKHHRKQFRRHNTLQPAQMTRSHKMVLVRKLCSFLHITHLYMARITLWGIPQCQMMFGMVCLCCWPFFRHSVRENRQK